MWQVQFTYSPCGCKQGDSTILNHARTVAGHHPSASGAILAVVMVEVTQDALIANKKGFSLT